MYRDSNSQAHVKTTIKAEQLRLCYHSSQAMKKPKILFNVVSRVDLKIIHWKQTKALNEKLCWTKTLF